MKENELTNEESEEFKMTEDEIQEVKQNSFNSFWSTKNMEYDKPYKFKALGKMMTRMIPSKFDDEETARIVLAIEDDKGNVYDLVANKEGKSSMTTEMRRLYADTKGETKGRFFIITKKKYKHKKWGEADGFSIRLIDEIDE